jgi:hypothetical protein
MKTIPMKLLVVVALLAACWRAEASGTWTPLVNKAPGNVTALLLLTDGTVIINDSSTSWWRLTPDVHGSYVNGTWSNFPSMNHARLYYASQVLANGNVFIAGAEDGDTGSSTSAEVWNSQSNTWNLVPNTDYPFRDAISKLLPDGKVLVNPFAVDTVLYDPVSNTTAVGPPTVVPYQEESDWVHLPDESILTVDFGATTSERYIPSLNQWIQDTSTPVYLWDTAGEIGSFHLLPNGKVFCIGAAPLTAIYTPSGSTAPGTWVKGPAIPNNLGATDAPAASMVNGKILMTVDPTGTYNPPTTFYEYDYVANALTQVNGPAGTTLNTATYVCRMLALPDGSILFSDGGTQFYVYQPDGTPLAAGKPSIQTLTTNPDGSFHLTGTGFNGISEGAKYNDDAQMDTNWPIVRATNNASGNVYYAKTFGWNPGVVATGTAVMATNFSFPASLPPGTYSLVVVANGNSSDAVTFNPYGAPSQVAKPTFSPGGGTYTSAQTVIINDSTNGATIRYTTDGSTPSETNGTVYSVSISIGSTATLQAIAYKSGDTDSSVASATYTVSNGSGCTSESGTTNTTLSSAQTGTFTITWDATPSISGINATMSLCNGNQTAYANYACIARFYTNGVIDAYNGTGYNAASTIAYTGGTTYHFEMDVNVSAKTYTEYVTPAGGSKTLVGSNYVFRLGDTTLNTFNVDISGSGSVNICNLSLGGTPPPQVATPTFSPSSGTYTSAQSVTISDSTSGATIYYTTNGSTPTTSSTVYSSPISVSSGTVTIEALGAKSGDTNSAVASGTYTISISPPPQVATPTFSPGSGTYTSAQSVTISDSTSGATIYYTTNGSTPTTSSTVYSSPISVSSGTVTIEAMGAKSGDTNSAVASATYTINSSSGCITATVSGGWKNSSMPSQTGTFTATFDATPSASPTNAVVALSNGAQTAYANFACLARFNPSGDIDARNGGAYAAASTIPYSAGVSYHFRLVVNVSANIYSIYVTPAGGSELTVGLNYGFRISDTSLSYWGLYVDPSSGGAGTVTVCNFSP